MGTAEVLEGLDLVERSPDRSYFLGARDDEIVSAVEQELGLQFPPSYRMFVRRLGAGSFGSSEFYGVIDRDIAESGIPDAAWVTLRMRSEGGLAPTFLVVGSDGMGAYYVLDAAKDIGAHESPVYVWEPGRSSSQSSLEVLAEDFGSYFLDVARRESGQV